MTTLWAFKYHSTNMTTWPHTYKMTTQPKSIQISVSKKNKKAFKYHQPDPHLTYTQTSPVLFYNHEAEIHLYQRWTPAMIELLRVSTYSEHSIKTMPLLPKFRPPLFSDTEISGLQDSQKLPPMSDTFAVFPHLWPHSIGIWIWACPENMGRCFHSSLTKIT